MNHPLETIEKDINLKRKFLYGNTRKILEDPLAFLIDLTKDHGPVVAANFIGKKYFIFQHPQFIKHVLVDNHKSYYKPGATKLLRYFLGEGLSTSNGALWKRQRKIMQPAFHKQRLQQLVDVINEETTTLINSWKLLTANTEINITHEFLQLTIRTISRSLFSTALEGEMKTMIDTLEALAGYASRWMKSIVKIPLHWPTPANSKFAKDCKTFDDIIYNIIYERIKDKKDDMIHGDLLDMLLDDTDDENQTKIQLRQIKDEVTTMFMAGHETTAQTLSWIFYHIANDKEIMTSLKDEFAAILQNKLIAFEDLPHIKYTTQVISEALRKYPPIWAIVRKPLADDCFNGLTIPTSANVLLNVYGMHHHPTYWETPEAFNPTHFNAATQNQRPSYAYLPFGGGPRLCIGSNFAIMVMQIVISRLISEFNFDVPNDYFASVEPNITLRAKGGIRLKLNKI